MKNPPILVAVIGFFAALAGFGNLFFGFHALGFDWFGVLGDLPPFESVGLWGWLGIATGILWLLVAVGLWALQPWARVFAMAVAGFALFEAVLAMFQFTGSGVGFGMAILPALLLLYLGSREIRAAFEGEELPAAPAATPAPAPEPIAASVPPAAPLAVAAAAPVAAAASQPEAAPAAAPAAAGSLRLDGVEGIGPAHAASLAAAGIVTTDDLLRAGAKPSGRDSLAEATGISGKLLLEWVNNADLMRVPGIGPQYSDLLEAAGVDSPAELAQRNPANLATTFQEVVAARPGTVRRIPSEAEVADWIEAAGTLEKVVEH